MNLDFMREILLSLVGIKKYRDFKDSPQEERKKL